MLSPWKESYDQLRQYIKKQRHYFANRGLSGQGYGFSSGRVWMWELDCEESWAQENWCFWTVVLEKTLQSPLDCKEIQPAHPKGDQSWVFIGRTDVEAETSTLATSCEELTHWKRPWCWEGLGAGGEGDDRRWDGWMASLTSWAWIWVNSGCWSRTGRPVVLWLMGLQRVRHDWVTELNWTDDPICVWYEVKVWLHFLSYGFCNYPNTICWKDYSIGNESFSFCCFHDFLFIFGFHQFIMLYLSWESFYTYLIWVVECFWSLDKCFMKFGKFSAIIFSNFFPVTFVGPALCASSCIWSCVHVSSALFIFSPLFFRLDNLFCLQFYWFFM